MIIKDEEKSFMTLASGHCRNATSARRKTKLNPGFKVEILFFPSLTAGQNKLECLSLASLFGLVWYYKAGSKSPIRFTADKRSSLVHPAVSDGEKKFYNIGTWFI
jgi:hypothetical protein